MVYGNASFTEQHRHPVALAQKPGFRLPAKHQPASAGERDHRRAVFDSQAVPAEDHGIGQKWLPAQRCVHTPSHRPDHGRTRKRRDRREPEEKNEQQSARRKTLPSYPHRQSPLRGNTELPAVEFAETPPSEIARLVYVTPNRRVKRFFVKILSSFHPDAVGLQPPFDLLRRRMANSLSTVENIPQREGIYGSSRQGS